MVGSVGNISAAFMYIYKREIDTPILFHRIIKTQFSWSNQRYRLDVRIHATSRNDNPKKKKKKNRLARGLYWNAIKSTRLSWILLKWAFRVFDTSICMSWNLCACVCVFIVASASLAWSYGDHVFKNQYISAIHEIENDNINTTNLMVFLSFDESTVCKCLYVREYPH